MKGQGALHDATAAKFSDTIELVSEDGAYGFLGASTLTKAEALEVIGRTAPKRFCCYNGLTQGRWTMGLDIAVEGAAAKPMAIDFLTVTQPKIERIVLRAPKPDENTTMLAAWATPAPARVVTVNTATPGADGQ